MSETFEESVESELRYLAHEFDNVTPTLVEEESDLNLEVVETAFGCLNNAVRSAWNNDGLHYRERMIDVAQLVYFHKGSEPTRDEFIRETQYESDHVRAEFPDWSDMSHMLDDPLNELGYEPAADPDDDLPIWIQRTQKIYGPNWIDRAEEIRERDDKSCRICSSTKDDRALHVHHITPRSEFVEDGELDYFEANMPDNLITLCPSCHNRVEGMWTGATPDEFASKGRQFLGFEEIED